MDKEYTCLKLRITWLEIMSLVCDWLKSLKFSDGYISNNGNCVNTAECTTTGLKSYNYH